MPQLQTFNFDEYTEESSTPALSCEYITAVPEHTTYALRTAGTVTNNVILQTLNEIEWSHDLLIMHIDHCVPIIGEQSILNSQDIPRSFIIKYDDDYYLLDCGVVYKIHSLSCRNNTTVIRNLMDRYILCPPEEIPLNARFIRSDINGSIVYGAQIENNNIWNIDTTHDTWESINEEIRQREAYRPWTRADIYGDTSHTVSTENRENDIIENAKYEPTEQEINYPELYVRNHKFNCKSKEPIIVGEWANNFNIIISKRLAKLGF